MSLNGCLGNSKIGGCKGICSPFTNPSPTFRQPFADLFCQPLSKPLFPFTPATRLETWVYGFFGFEKTCLSRNPEHRLLLSESAEGSRNPWVAYFHADRDTDLSPCNFATTLLPPCNFATTHLTASILSCYLP